MKKRRTSLIAGAVFLALGLAILAYTFRPKWLQNECYSSFPQRFEYVETILVAEPAGTYSREARSGHDSPEMPYGAYAVEEWRVTEVLRGDPVLEGQTVCIAEQLGGSNWRLVARYGSGFPAPLCTYGTPAVLLLKTLDDGSFVLQWHADCAALWVNTDGTLCWIDTGEPVQHPHCKTLAALRTYVERMQ